MGNVFMGNLAAKLDNLILNLYGFLTLITYLFVSAFFFIFLQAV